MYRSFLLPNKGQIPVCRGIKREMTGVNLAGASQTLCRVKHTSGHTSTEEHTERRLFYGPMRRSVSAGRSETIGLPRGAAQRAHCSLPPTPRLEHAVECNMGRQAAFSSPHTFLSKIWKSQEGPPRDTAAGHSGNKDSALDFTRIKAIIGICFNRVQRN